MSQLRIVKNLLQPWGLVGLNGSEVLGDSSSQDKKSRYAATTSL